MTSVTGLIVNTYQNTKVMELFSQVESFIHLHIMGHFSYDGEPNMQQTIVRKARVQLHSKNFTL